MSKKLLIAALISAALILVLYSCTFYSTAEAQTAPAAVSQPEPTGVFRGFIWGLSKADVRTYETAIFYKEEGNSVYFLLPPDDSFLPPLKPNIRYDFKDDNLVSAEFGYYELDNPNGQAIINLFMSHAAELNAQFGTPVKEEMIWNDQKYKPFPQFWARAILSQDLKFKTTWLTKDTEIVLQAYRDRDNYKLFYTAAKIDAPSGGPADVLQLNILPPAKP